MAEHRRPRAHLSPAPGLTAADDEPAAVRHPYGVRARLSVSPETYARVASAALAALGVIVLTGAAVRLSGSGLGCPDWPTCAEGTAMR